MKWEWLRGPFGALAVVAVAGLVGLGYVVAATGSLALDTTWSKKELAGIDSLWIGNLGRVPADPTDRYADDAQAAALGHKLFFDARFSSNGKVACSTCHQPAKLFQDGRSRARGLGPEDRRTPSLVGAAYSPWQFWDGRKDSLWAQPVAPVESPVEMGSDRTFVAHQVERYYRRDYERIFGPLPAGLSRLPKHAGPVPEHAARVAWKSMTPAQQQAVSRVMANVGKALEAYERKLVPGPARFDRYAQAVLSGHQSQADSILTGQEAEGLRLFIGAGNCIECHNGPLFTNFSFENVGVAAVPGLPPDPGRMRGAKLVLKDEFNGAGPFSDAKGDSLKLRTMTTGPSLLGAFKTPSLRNVARIAPYMHAGQLKTLKRVVAFYSRAPAAPLGRTLVAPLSLTAQQQVQLVAFLETLSGPLATDPRWLRPP